MVDQSDAASFAATAGRVEYVETRAQVAVAELRSWYRAGMTAEVNTIAPAEK